MYTWTIDHPYWVDFRDKLLNSGLLRERAIMGYSRYQEKNATQSATSVREEEILPREYVRIEGIQGLLSQRGTLAHAKLLDFDIDRFSSPALTEGFRREGKHFSRRYVEFSGKNSKWLAVFSAFPMGGSLNRLPEAIWAFQFAGSLEDGALDWPEVASALFAYALSLGIKPSSIRRVTGSDRARSFPGEVALMEVLLAHPSASALYKRKR